MTDDRLTELRRLCEAATKGKWFADQGLVNTEADPTGGIVNETISDADAAFIAASRDALPRLLDEVEGLRWQAWCLMWGAIGCAADADRCIAEMHFANAENARMREGLLRIAARMREGLLLIAEQCHNDDDCRCADHQIVLLARAALEGGSK